MSKKWINQLIKKSGLTWSEIAERAEVSRTTVWRWKNGIRVNARRAILLTVCRATGKTESEIQKLIHHD